MLYRRKRKLMLALNLKKKSPIEKKNRFIIICISTFWVILSLYIKVSFIMDINCPDRAPYFLDRESTPQTWCCPSGPDNRCPQVLSCWAGSTGTHIWVRRPEKWTNILNLYTGTACACTGYCNIYINWINE